MKELGTIIKCKQERERSFSIGLTERKLVNFCEGQLNDFDILGKNKNVALIMKMIVHDIIEWRAVVSA